ncbi:exonuclease SbcCD subunit D [Planctomyces sp. SH-PL62]|uniref:metallophosphoesterase family protein n=1 Tax=Planctomyces sp. SH-PL62 TaxID=1636152 RepID=UPI00078E909E|nr:DNA repair exonuclease [Planctomyces sp. SH-PL62]AMV40648.1 putative metallophosphoesterase YhaO [Planctomyces sp. SH-PL62]
MKFVHAADLHIDSPLRGLEHYEGAPVERVRLATRAALTNLVRVCIEEEASFLVVAGDLFDGDWNDFNTALFAAAQMRALRNHGVRVFVIRGNHDSRDEMSYRVPWPDNFHMLDYREPETVVLEDLGVAIHGMSFPRRELTENLVPRYPKPIKGLMNIGLLHTNATGSLDHDSYAPCSVGELAAKGYDYWGLGHIHKREVLHEGPHVVYPGNTQGRHVRETGDKGCVVATVRGGEVASLDFRSTDVLRWRRETIALEPEDGVDELIDAARVRLKAVADEADGRLAAVRLEVKGRCRAHRILGDETRRLETVAQLRALPGEFTEDLWVEKIKMETDHPLDRDQLRKGRDVLGDLLRSIDGVRSDQTALGELGLQIRKLTNKVALELKDEGDLEFAGADQLARWLRQAEDELLNRLTTERRS